MAIDLNNAPLQNEVTSPTVYHDVEAIAAALAQCADRWVPELFPQGRIVAGELRLANIRGAAPRKQGSCVVQLTGDHAGSWYEHETKQGGGPLSTLKEALRLSGEALLRHAVSLIEQHGATSYLARGSASHGPAARPAVDKNASEIAINLANMGPLVGTLGETYLRARGLSGLPETIDLGFYGGCTHWATRSAVPALIARFRYPDGTASGGIHRIYLRDDGSWHNGDKLMLGPVDGAVVMLGAIGADGALGIGEGIESVLAGMELFGIGAGWACASDGGMRKFAAWLRLNVGRLEISMLHIWADAKRAGAAAGGEVYATALELGLECSLHLPRSGDDFAADLLGGLLPGVGTGNGATPPPSWSAGPQAEPEILVPGASIDPLAAARALGREYEASAVTAILRAMLAANLDPVAQDQILSTIQKRTGMAKRALDKALRSERSGTAVVVPWMSQMALYDSGEPKPIMMNIAIVLRNVNEWRDVLGFNEFSEEIWILRHPPWEDDGSESWVERAWNDVDELKATEWIQKFGIHAAGEPVYKAVRRIAEEKRFNPVKEYLESLVWDKIGRLNDWLMDYLGAKPDVRKPISPAKWEPKKSEEEKEFADAWDARVAYFAAVGSRFLISAVARIFKPGCKADCALILEGNQGLRKSMALRTLFGTDWFTDDMPDIGSKDASLQTRGVWGIELAELDAMRKADISKIKSFLTRQVDHYRPPYAVHSVKIPRQCVFCGSVNDYTWLRDPTGGRRFWPVPCGVIEVDKLKEARDQLWAEAVFRYHKGESWWLHEEGLINVAAEEQAQRYDGDVWDDIIGPWLERQEGEITVGQVLREALHILQQDWTRSDQTRVGNYLHASGWRSQQIRSGEERGKRRYRKIDENEAESEC